MAQLAAPLNHFTVESTAFQAIRRKVDNIVKILFLDPAGGIAGDMALAALTGLGFDPKPVQQGLNAAGLEVTITPEPRTINGLAGYGVRIEAPEAQPLRHLHDLTAIVDASGAPAEVAARTNAALKRLAEVEAAVHGASLESVHFHEVGAVDTVADVLGAFWGLHALGVERVECGSLPWFGGTVCCEHGVLPLPAPAVLKLLENKPVHQTTVREEIITPTGALLVDQLTDAYVPGPTGTVVKSAVGYGDKVVENHPNGLRVTLLEV